MGSISRSGCGVSVVGMSTDFSGEQRTGPFWDGVTGRAPVPPAARTLGLEVVEADPHGVVELAFTATDAFTNPAGNVLGAFLAAMLYDTVGPALLATLAPDEFQSTLQMNVDFVRPTRPGRIVARGRVKHRDGDHAVLEASLHDATDALLASATAIARVIGLDAARAAV